MSATPYSEVEDFLEHYGVLGMKWGVRKDRRGNSPRAAKREIRREVRADKKTVKTAVDARGKNSKAAREARRVVREKTTGRMDYAAEARRQDRNSALVKGSAATLAYLAAMGVWAASVDSINRGLAGADRAKARERDEFIKFMRGRGAKKASETINNKGHLIIKDLGGGKWDFVQK